MSNPTERSEINKVIEELFPVISNGNKYAEDYLYKISISARVLDDIIDKDVEIKDEDIIKAFFNLAVGINVNPFYVQNMFFLNGIILIAINAWLDANEWSKGDKNKQIHSHVIRDYINEICQAVAFLTGGFSHMRSISLKVRDAFLKEVD